MRDVRLRVEGQDYGGWTAVTVHRSIEQLAGGFELTVTESWPGTRGERIDRPIKPGHACELRVDGAPVMLGYVDEVEPSYDAESRSVTVKGRDRTADLIDCAATVGGSVENVDWSKPIGGWANVTLTQVAKNLCAPFGIEVSADVDVGGPLPYWSILPGETVFENLEKFARLRAVLLTTDAKGNLRITRASSDRVGTALRHGLNIMAMSGALSLKERGNVYVVTSHSIFQGNDQAMTAVTRDAGVHRHRPIVVIAEDTIAPVDWAKRSKWEASVRAGRGTQLEVTVQDWRHDTGLWEPNRLVSLTDPWLGFDAEDLLISGVRWVFDDRGTRAMLTLTRPEAFSLIPVRLQGLFESMR